RHRPLRAPRPGQHGDGHVPRRRGGDGGRPVELPRRAAAARRYGAAGDAAAVGLGREGLTTFPLVLDGGLATSLEASGHDLSGALWSARLLADDPSRSE